MNSLVLLPLFAAVALAAPQGLFHSGIIPGAVSHSSVAAPSVAHVQVPVTKTVHFETKPVVTGFSTSIIKPAIPHFATPTFVAQPQVVVAEQRQVVVAPAPAPVAVAQPVIAHDAEIVEARAAVPVAAPAPVAVAPAPVAVAPAPVAVVRPAQAGDFWPLVTKEHVLAPVRTHTHITPQITQVQPEVTVRKVIHDVPVAQPIAVHTPVQHVVTNPVVAGPAPLTHGANVFAGHPQFVF